MDIAVYSVLLLSGLALIAYPFRSRRGQAPVRFSSRVEHGKQLVTDKEAVYAAIKDLDFEYKTGKLSDEDYAELREGYRVRALNILRESDQAQMTTATDAPICAQCAHTNPCGSNFCEACGAPLAAELTCDKCGTARKPTDRFCGVCGNPV